MADKYNDSAIRNVSRVNVIEIGNSYLDNVSPRDVSYCGIIVVTISTQYTEFLELEYAYVSNLTSF